MLRLQSRLFWLFVLVGHAFGAAAWVALMPRGFPLLHPRFWANVGLPILIILAVAAAMTAARAGRLAVVRVILAALAYMWVSAAVTGRITFPVSTQSRWLAPLALGAAVMLSAYGGRLREFRWPVRWTILAVLLGMSAGAAMPLLQRAPEPSTFPLNDAAIAPVAATQPVGETPRTRRLGRALVQLNDGQVTLDHRRYMIYVNPLLSFTSRSPDRCWTSLAPRDLRVGPRRRLVSPDLHGIGAHQYEDDGRSTLAVREADDLTVSIVARSQLDRPVYSHLNTFSELQLAGHRRLSISFSPCPSARIDVLPSDYPVGRPARCAYLGADGIFRVVEASSGEKGPFRELASGPLSREQPLGITFFDDGTPFCRVTLDDFAAQASTDLSPTAGWGLPMNAIEFSLGDDRPTSPASVFVALAGTSVGRGWDSVGHAAGTYRNRMTIEFDPAVDNVRNAEGGERSKAVE